MLSVCFALFAAIIITAAVLSIISYRKKWKDLSPFRIMFGGTFASVCTLLIPAMDFGLFSETDPKLYRGFMRFFLALINSVQVFTVDIGADGIIKTLSDTYNTEALYPLYSVVLVTVMVICPALTAAFILSFVRDFYAVVRLKLSYRRDRYIFSELNEKSLALAKDVYNNRKNSRNKAAFIFNDVFRKNEESSYELLEEARKINAICLKRDIVTMNTKPHSAKSKLYLFAIGENETENVEQAVHLIDYYKDVRNTELFVFSTRTDGEMILARANRGSMRVRRVNEVRSLVYRLLYNDGKAKILDTAERLPNGTGKISAAVIGMGLHGTEMLKALTWFCQSDGISLKINAFDIDGSADKKFASVAPDLLNQDYNGVAVRGEANYNIIIHPGVDVNTADFYKKVKEHLEDATYVFLSLGSDENNIRAAAGLRMMFARMDKHPVIQTVVYNTNVRDSLAGSVNFKRQPYDIDFVGSIGESFTEEVIIKSDLEKKAKEYHLQWDGEDSFWNYEYNYNSSMALAVYYAPGRLDESDDPEKLAETEHCRWNAYMRSNGYVYSPVRFDLAKNHPNLVKFSKLSPEEQEKDRKIIEWEKTHLSD